MSIVFTKNYWITPTGDIKKCGSHAKYAKLLFPNAIDVYKDMYNKRYVKVIIEPLPEMYVHYKQGSVLTKAQKEALNILSFENGLNGQYESIPELREQKIGYKDFFKP